MRQVIEPSPVTSPLPQLAESDSFTIDTLASLIGDKSLLKWFHPERIINNIVATIDNLPRNKAPMRVMPIEQAAGKFLTNGGPNEISISPKNAERYAPYIKIAEAIDARKAVELYVRLYPLFQKAYQEIGYPKGYFNDRLIIVLDDLLAAPQPKEPIKLVQHSVSYQFADPDLESLSIGKRILMRIGSENEATLKAKLREIKQQLLLHMHEKTVDNKM